MNNLIIFKINKSYERCFLAFFLLMNGLTQSQALEKKSGKTGTVGELLKKIETKSVKINKQDNKLPEFSKIGTSKTLNLKDVKPPSKSNMYYEEGSNEAELEKVTDQQIRQAYKLTQQFKNSRRRGELWLRLAELYVEKSRMIEYRLQNEYDVKLKKFQSGESKLKPRLNLQDSQSYNQKAIQLYEAFLNDFPNDPKGDQALFFLGYNYFELNNEAKGKSFYELLTQKFPNSPFVDESRFALGEYYFDQEKWGDAVGYYQKVAANKEARLYSFGLYKTAWCEYKLGKVKEGLKYLERVIRVGRIAKSKSNEASGGVSHIRLASEALKDLVVFYAEVGSPESAQSYFQKVAGEKNVLNLTEKLAYYYADSGNKTGAKILFKELVERNPNSPKAYDYQYQIVNMYAATGDAKVFKDELYQWITLYGPESKWAQVNSKNKDLINKANLLIESTLRNYVLQQHQTAQNSHTEFAQKLALAGYELYFNTFKDSVKLDEMHFFFAELLFDLQNYERAAYHYMWVNEHAPKSKYNEKSLLNAVLSLEKKLPHVDEIRKEVGDTTEPVEFDKIIKSFEKAAKAYLQAFPNHENSVAINYRLGSLYYYYNQFDKALVIFEEVYTKHPKSQFAEFAANLTLDIYNIRKDYVGLEKAGQKILVQPELAHSGVGNQIKNILQRASFKKAQDLETGKNYLKSAEAYESFSRSQSQSELTETAMFNAGVNYERGGDLNKALEMYVALQSAKSSKNANLKKNASKFIAILYEKTGQYAHAAQAFENYAHQNEKDKESVNFYFNAGVIYDGLNQYQKALNCYQRYFDLSRNKDRNEALFLMAKVWEKKKSPRQSLEFYQKYFSANPKNGSSLIETALAIAKLFEAKGQKKLADEWYQKTISIQQRISKPEAPIGVANAAHAKFRLVYKTFEELKSIRIPAQPQKQAKVVQQKLAFLDRLKNELARVIKYDDGDQIVASLTLIGQAYQHMAASIYAVPLPKNLDAEGLKTYQKGVEDIAKPFQAEAIKNYQTAIEKGRQLEAYNDWFRMAQRELSVLNSSTNYDNGEKIFLTRMPDWLGI
ncbi:MAG: tetratricopeptide repeat protein [Bdellovibrionales bacterium]|nr:tetratricopeptide repeat protein [Bdellovibrionales bacterium]